MPTAANGAEEKKANELHIYVNTTVSGLESYLGISMVDAANSFVSRINQKGGLLGYSLRVIVQDDQGKLETSIANAEVALKDPVHFATFGSAYSRISLPVAKLYLEKHKLFFTPMATSVAFAALKGTVFQLCFNDAYQGKELAEITLKRLHAKRILVVANHSDPYSDGLAAEYQARLAGQAVMTKEYGFIDGEPFVEGLASQVSNFKPDLVFLPVLLDQAAESLREFNRLRLNGFEVMGSDSWGIHDKSIAMYMQTGARELHRSHFMTFHWEPSLNFPRSKQIVAALKRQNPSSSPYVTGIFTYEGLLFLEAAAERTKSTNAIKLAQAIRGQTFEGATGPVRFGTDGVTYRSVVILRLSSDGVHVDHVSKGPATP